MLELSKCLYRLENMVESQIKLVEFGGTPSLETIRITKSYARSINNKFQTEEAFKKTRRILERGGLN